jgi:hypothetical protein
MRLYIMLFDARRERDREKRVFLQIGEFCDYLATNHNKNFQALNEVKSFGSYPVSFLFPSREVVIISITQGKQNVGEGVHQLQFNYDYIFSSSL